MATEPSLLCVNCARPPPPHRRTWGRCTVCVARNLPSTYYCGEECMNAHWPKHKVWHAAQKQNAKQWSQDTSKVNRSLAEAEARFAERTGDEFDKRCADAMALGAEGDFNAAAKAWRKIIKQWPNQPGPCHNLGIVMQTSGRHPEAAQMYLEAMELYEDGTQYWAESAASTFDILRTDECHEQPKPEWWNDEGLKALSARVVALASDEALACAMRGREALACAMRGRVLMGAALYEAQWNASPRTAAEIKEAATWFRRAAMVAHTPAVKQRHEEHASLCDEYAGPLLAEEDAEAAKARAAAAAEEAEALKVAEAKATAAADELLAEEEKEKQRAAASSKADQTKQGKGKKGKGRC